MLTRVLCGAVSPPGMVPELKVPPPGLPLRKHFEAHASQPACAACHARLDPVGFAFEAYDSTGKYRTVDSSGQPVDATGSLILPRSGAKIDFKDALDLVDKVATSDDASECLATEWFRFAAGRAEVKQDDGSRAVMRETFRRSQGDVRELLVAIARSRTFTHRQPLPGEDTP